MFNPDSTYNQHFCKELMLKWFYGLHENVRAIVITNQTAMPFLIHSLRQADVSTHNSHDK